MSISHIVREALLAKTPQTQKTAVAEATRPRFLVGRLKASKKRANIFAGLTERYNANFEVTSSGSTYTSFMVYGGDSDVEVDIWFHPHSFNIRLVVGDAIYHFSNFAITHHKKTLDVLAEFEAGDQQLYPAIIRKLTKKAYSTVIETH